MVGENKLEVPVGNKIADLIIHLKDFSFAVEVDLSCKNSKKETQTSFLRYEEAYKHDMMNKRIVGIVYYTNRVNKVSKWLTEASEGYIKPYYCNVIPRNIELVIRRIAQKKDHPLKGGLKLYLYSSKNTLIFLTYFLACLNKYSVV